MLLHNQSLRVERNLVSTFFGGLVVSQHYVIRSLVLLDDPDLHVSNYLLVCQTNEFHKWEIMTK